MGFEKGHIPHNKSNDLIFYSDSFSYCGLIFDIKSIRKLYLEDNIEKTELLKILNMPMHKLNRIIKHYNLQKSKTLSNQNVCKNTDYSLSVQKVKATKLERYGDEKYSNRAKAKQTCLERYGEDNIFKTERFKINLIKYNQEKYGCEYNSQAREIKEKKKQTCLNHYGVLCPFQCEEIKEKIKQRNLKNLGVEYPTQSSSVMDKQRATNILRYGRKYGFDYEKSRRFYLERYGVEYFTQTCEFHQKAKKKYIYRDQTFDSFPELCLYIYALDNQIPIKRSPVKFTYTYMGKNHYYIPDFEYDNTLIEIKGEHFFKDNRMINPFDRSQDGLYEAKHQCGLINNVEFWTSKDYNFVIKYFVEKGYRREDYEN